MIGGAMLVWVTVMVVFVCMVMRVMMGGMDLVDETKLFEQGMRRDGRPDGRQQQRKHATDKPHPGRVNKVCGRATFEMDRLVGRTACGLGLLRGLFALCAGVSRVFRGCFSGVSHI